MKTRLTFLFMFFISLSFCGISVFGQAGVSTLSFGTLQAGIGIHSDDIRVEEFINYHRHLIPLPKHEQRLAMDLKSLAYRDKSYLQIGLATPRAIDSELAPLLNLVIVVDCSGSMASGNRIERVRNGLSMLVERLRPDDHISIVTFSSEASCILSSNKKTKQSNIQKAIDSLRPMESTNLHAGLMLGYDIALKNFDQRRSNRVIFLTDGLANVGVTDPKEIAQDSARFNRKGIDLSTIGVGNNFNQELLRELGIAGRGAVHFVDDHQDLTKCFVDEVDSLLAPATRNLKLIISSPHRTNKGKVFGYQPTTKNREIKLDLENMSCGATQVVLIEFEEALKSTEIDVSLRFDDAVSGREKTVVKTIRLKSSRDKDSSKRLTQNKHNASEDRGDFKKNLAIAFIAQSIKDAAIAFESGESEHGLKLLKKGFKRSQELGDWDEDADHRRVKMIADELMVKGDRR